MTDDQEIGTADQPLTGELLPAPRTDAAPAAVPGRLYSPVVGRDGTLSLPEDPDAWVSEATAEAINKGVAESSKTTYRWALDEFAAFAAASGRRAMPATGETLAEYVMTLCARSLAPKSIQLQIAAIRSTHREAGFKAEPDTAKARRVLRAYAKKRAEAGEANSRQAPPVTTNALRSMVAAAEEHYGAGHPAADRDRLALVLGLSMYGRRSELAALNLGDVRESEDGLEVTIRKSKTDQDAVGELVAIPCGRYAATDAVRLLRAWKKHLPEDEPGAAPLLRAVDRHGRIGARLSGAAVSGIVRRNAERAGLPDPGSYSGHSLRAGGATESYKGGSAPNAIAKHGRWAENSPVVLGYIRAADKWKDNPVGNIDL